MGFDANALYLWAIGQPMLCGDHQRVDIHDNLLSDVLNGSFYGAIECDIEVPDHLKSYFSEMQPVFKNVDISFHNLSSDTQKQVKTSYQSKKLIGSFFGKKVLLITDVLQWYLQKGLIVSNITYAVRYEKKAPFKSFVDTVSNARRAGDKSTDYKLIGEMMKLIGNSAYGKCLTNFEKHETVKIVSETAYNKNIRRNNYKSHEDLIEGYEFHLRKSSFKQCLPIQVGFAVYQLAKLRMLQFYYDFIDYYIDRSDFEYCEMDTDSAYIAFSSASFEDLVKPCLKQPSSKTNMNCSVEMILMKTFCMINELPGCSNWNIRVIRVC
ncbi:unnamed protein product [Rotaria socialis]|nr:unnamed protein product [Rotaria socialis]